MMNTDGHPISDPPKRRTSLIGLAAAAGACVVLASAPVLAQGWNWPWEQQAPKPVPREPAWRPPDPPVAPPPVAQPGPPGGGWVAKSNICLTLEQRLVQEGQRGNQSRDLIPMMETQIRQVDQQYRTANSQLERSDCFDFFLFSKTLRRTRKCVDLANQVDGLKRQLADLDTQRQQLSASSGRSYQDDIIRELARNNCGASYAQEARKRDSQGPFSSLWQDEETSGAGGLGNYGNLGYATYRTLCVRLCDGYYFPISFSTLPNHFERDAELCQSKCAAPVGLYFHQNPGGAVDQMVSFGANEPYTQLKSAFRYRKEYVQGCSCKEAEFVPQTPIPQQNGDAAPAAGAPLTTGSTNRAAAAPATSAWSTETNPQ